MEMKTFNEAKSLVEDIQEIEKLINKFNNKTTYESAGEYDLYEEARDVLHSVLACKKVELANL